jgi:hypothetical protein
VICQRASSTRSLRLTFRFVCCRSRPRPNVAVEFTERRPEPGLPGSGIATPRSTESREIGRDLLREKFKGYASAYLVSIPKTLVFTNWHNCQDFPLGRHGRRGDLEFPEVPTPLTQKVAKGIGEFETYIRNNEEFIPNFGERYRNGETISTAFVESTVDQVMSKRMVKKQHAMDTPRGAFTPADPNKNA